MKTKQFNFFVVIGLMIVLPYVTFAQTKRDAVEAYNAGASIIIDDPEGALNHLYRALELSEDLEYEGEETKVLAESLIPTAHFNFAMKVYREKKMYETLDQLEKALVTSKKYFDKNTQGKVERIIPQLYNQMGGNERRNDNYEKAIGYYTKSIEIKEDYPDPYLGIALSYEKLENFESMLEYLKLTLDVAKSTNNRAMTEDVLKKANNYLLSNAQEYERSKDHQKAIEFYTKYLEFDSSDAAVVFKIGDNSLLIKEWDQAIESFNKALELGNSSLDPALLYYQIGVAYQGKNLKNEACEAFKKAATGQYLENAKYQMEQVLKCE